MFLYVINSGARLTGESRADVTRYIEGAPELKKEKGRQHGYPSRPATMEQKNAYGIDVHSGNGEQV
jgi:hypothetical protein